MQNLLETYKSYNPLKVCFLDSTYVDEILSEYPGYSKTFIQCDLDEGNIKFETNALKLDTQSKIDLIVRLRIKMYNPESDDYSYHINILIFDMLKQTITHFEPLETYDLGIVISEALRSRFSYTLPGFKFNTLSFHPQKEMDDECKNMGLCVAHVIKFVICHLYCSQNLLKVRNYDYDDIYRFCAAIMDLY